MKKNIVFYCHNFGGLGHTRRISLIIKEILNNFGDFYNVIFLNSGTIQDFLFDDIEGVKIINLPNYNIKDYKIIDGEKVFKYRIDLYSKIFSIGNIDSLIIEHFPFGRNFLDNEIINLINIYKQYNIKGNVFSSVRDIFDINSLNKENLKLFDRFLIHGDKRIINYNEKLPSYIRKKIIYTGYVLENNPLDSYKEEDYIIMNLGGGQDGIEYILDFLNKYKKLELNNKIYINLGLSYTNLNINLINDLKIKNITIKDYFSNFIELKRRAKIVVSMGGYNSFIENISYNKITIIYPRVTDNEQIIRLEKFIDKFKNIYDGRIINENDIRNILNINNKIKQNSFNNLGAYFSASFIVNFNKYKYIKIRLTNVCNAKCDMCGVIKRKDDYNDFLKLKESILEFYKLGGEVVNFTGGEPTIYNGFWDLLFLSKSLGLITSVSTNGSTLGDNFFKKLYKNNIKLIDYIDISVDGLYDLQDERRQYKGLFEKIESNLELLKNNKINVHINVTIRNDNIDEIKDISDFFVKRGINSISFGMITSSPVNDTSYLIPLKEQIDKFYNIDKKYIINNAGNTKNIFSPDFLGGDIDIFINSILNKNSFEKIKGDNCNFIKSKKEIRINENGNISPCCEIDDFDEGIGNINKKSLLTILCSEEYEKFLNGRFPYISKACLNCKIGQ